jgi:hypothetical protein
MEFLTFGMGFILLIVVVIPFWKIFQKAGFAPALSLVMLIPIVNIVALYMLAFSEWRGPYGGYRS